MTLLRAADIHLAWGSREVFRGLTFVIEEGERVGLVGVNGSGKSTLMKVLAGALAPDAGELQLRKGARTLYLAQEPEFPADATVASELTSDHTPAYEARKLLDRLGVRDWDRRIDELSGGLRKRVAIARALLRRPDLLMLDEPTNHLDADTVEWLEDELDTLRGALLLVTHDRYFLDGLVDRIVEIEPGGTLTSYPGNYQAYLETRLQRQEEEALRDHKRQRWIAQEVAWLRKGVEARRTKSRSRMERARQLMATPGREAPRSAALQLAAAPRQGHTVIETAGVAKAFDGRTVLSGVDLILRAGERVGIVGPNGAGKTTLLKLLLGTLTPDAGEVKRGKNARIAYYDQHRAQLDPEQTVYEAAWDDDWVTLGDRKVALRDYLDDLLFPVPAQRMKVAALSGGERNRLLLARLFLEGANLLALDEPTNDLDIVTLNVLEGLIQGFGGTVLLVTHDRYFLDKVATAILAVEGDGSVVRYEGNFSLYRRLRPAAAARPPERKPMTDSESAAGARPPPPRRPGKLSFKDQRELDGIEAAIEVAETRKQGLEATLNDPATYAERPLEVPRLTAELEAAGAEVDRLYARWQVLCQTAGL